MAWNILGNFGMISYFVLLLTALVARRFAVRSVTAARVIEAITGRPVADR